MSEDNVRYVKTSLGNGIRVVSESVPSSYTAALGIWVNTGSRDEAGNEEGMSHFVEHMLFKGTRTRDVNTIAREIDSLGGELSAFTTKEVTTYYVKVLHEALDSGIDLLSDLFLNSVIHEEDIEKEKQVIKSEIKMAEDDPEDLVDELHCNSVWNGHPLGKPILGREEKIEEITRTNLFGFMNHHYKPSNVIVAVSGRFDQKMLEKVLEEKLGKWGGEGAAGSKAGHTGPVWASKNTSVAKDLEQTQIIVGGPGLSVSDDKRYIMGVLNAVLGGSVSSRLFQEIREKRALAYSIYSEMLPYRDAGELNIYAAVHAEQKEHVLDLIYAELEKLTREHISRQELSNAKSLMKSEFIFGQESTSQRMTRIAVDEIYFGKSFRTKDILGAIESVTIEDVKTLASKLFRERAVTTLGPAVVEG